MTGDAARILVVVVSWEGAHLLPDCLASLQAQSLDRSQYDVVVVDNASTDDTVAVVGTFPGVRVVTTDRNLGFAGGADVAMRGFRGELVVLVNNDATLDPDALHHFDAAMSAPGAERVGAVTGKILLATPYRLDPDTGGSPPPGSFRTSTGVLMPTTADDPAGQTVLNSTGNVLRRRGSAEDRDWLQREGTESDATDVFGFCGGAAALRVRALDEVGLLDADLFLYYEDTDLSWRMRAAGWTVRYQPRAVARHLHAASSDAASPFFRFHNLRNALVVFTRHAPLRWVLLMVLRQLAATAMAVLRGPRSAEARTRLRALSAYARWLPRTLGDRRRTWAGVPRQRRRQIARYLA